MLRITETYDGFAVWNRIPATVGANEVTIACLVTEFTNTYDLARYLAQKTLEDIIFDGEAHIEIDGNKGNSY